MAPIEHVFAGLPVDDLDAAVDWYERLAGRAPDLIPNADEAAWQLAERAWIYAIRDPEHAGHGLFTVLVDDLDAFLAGLAERGIAAGEIETIPGAVRSVWLTDPAGNRIQIGQPLSGDG